MISVEVNTTAAMGRSCAFTLVGGSSAPSLDAESASEAGMTKHRATERAIHQLTKHARCQKASTHAPLF
jgi:hypothetical protein